jgi:UDP-N-acetylglucosamine 2-epimerase (non-hydrolysing)
MKILVVFGTRPEAVKLFPVVHALQKHSGFDVSVCVTAQHREMLDQVLDVADIIPDFDLNLMQPNQSLPDLTARILHGLDATLDQAEPDRVMVQGDTTTAMTAALSAYYRKIPVDHVEAGLRSGDNYSPYPEEVNRKVVSSIAALHFAPTEQAADALVRENVPQDRIFVTGNPVIDALLETSDRIDEFSDIRSSIDARLPPPGDNRKVILVTTHRRENFDGGIKNIGSAILNLVKREDVTVVFPVHPNPNVLSPIRSMLGTHPRIQLINPLDYVSFVYLLSRSHYVLTDSGGVQEEAPALGKPVLVMRNTTERPEGVSAGTALLVGTSPDRITAEALRLLNDRNHYDRMSRAHNPFGDGKASGRIVDILENHVGGKAAKGTEVPAYAI